MANYKGRSRAGKRNDQNKQFVVLADTREQTQWHFTGSKVISEVVTQKLNTGDYSVQGYEDVFCIERKASTSEIANNFTESRWKDVLDRLTGYQHKFIICEFSLENVLEFPHNSGIPRSKQQYVKITPNFLMSCLAKIQIKYDIPVIYAGCRSYAETIAESLMKQFVSTIHENN